MKVASSWQGGDALPDEGSALMAIRLLMAPISLPYRILLQPSLRLSVLVSLTCQCFWWLAIAANTTGYGEGDLTLPRRLAYHSYGLLLLLTYHEVGTFGLRILTLGRCKRGVLACGDLMLATIVGLLSAFHIATGAPLDIMLIIHNSNLLGASDSFSLITGRELLTAVTALALPPTLYLAASLAQAMCRSERMLNAVQRLASALPSPADVLLLAACSPPAAASGGSAARSSSRLPPLTIPAQHRSERYGSLPTDPADDWAAAGEDGTTTPLPAAAGPPSPDSGSSSPVGSGLRKAWGRTPGAVPSPSASSSDSLLRRLHGAAKAAGERGPAVPVARAAAATLALLQCLLISPFWRAAFTWCRSPGDEGDGGEREGSPRTKEQWIGEGKGALAVADGAQSPSVRAAALQPGWEASIAIGVAAVPGRIVHVVCCPPRSRGCLRCGGPDSASLWPLLLRFLVAATIMTHGLVTQPDVGADAVTPLVGAMVTPSTFTALPLHARHAEAMGIRPFDRFPFLQPHGPVPAVLLPPDAPVEGVEPRVPEAAAEAGARVLASSPPPSAGPSKEAAATASPSSPPLPHFVYTMLESAAGQLFMRNSSLSPGQQPMPNLGAWAAAEAIWADVFYSTSIQTARAQESFLCGSLSSFRQKGFEVPATELALRCLPRVLAEAGYVTFFFSAQEDLGFDNTGNAMREAMGFQYVEAMTQAQGADLSDRGGFGWADGPTYRAFWRRFDAIAAAHPGRPVFAMVTTVSNHYPFHVPPSEVTDPAFATVWDPITDAGAMQLSRSQRIYETSLHVMDKHWKANFLDGLAARPAMRDAVVLVTSDHSCPYTKRTRYTSIGAWEESFRVVFALRAPGRIRPGRLRVAGGSAADVTPTLLRLLGIRTAHHYAGTALQDRVPHLPEDASTGAFLPAPGEPPAPAAPSPLPPAPHLVDLTDQLGPMWSPFAASPAIAYAAAFAGIGQDGPATGAAYAAAAAASFARPPISRGRRLLSALHSAALDVADGLAAAASELVAAAGAVGARPRGGGFEVAAPVPAFPVAAPPAAPSGAAAASAVEPRALPPRLLRGLSHGPHPEGGPAPPWEAGEGREQREHGHRLGREDLGEKGERGERGADEEREGPGPRPHRVHHIHADGAAADGEDGLAEEREGGAAVVSRPALLAQPYGGVELVAVRWPFKLRYIRRQNRFSLFDLLADPAEERDFLGPRAPVWPPQLRVMDVALRRDLSVLLLHQTAFDERRLWPLPHELQAALGEAQEGVARAAAPATG